MVQHGGVATLVVTGAHQQLIIKEENGGFALEVLAFEDVQEEEGANVALDMPATLTTVVTSEDVEEDAPPQGNGLFEKLVALRKTLATADKVPPYMIFHNKTLQEMADTLPADMQALGSIAGVGQSKLDKYGAAFLSVINGGAEE